MCKKGMMKQLRNDNTHWTVLLGLLVASIILGLTIYFEPSDGDLELSKVDETDKLLLLKVQNVGGTTTHMSEIILKLSASAQWVTAIRDNAYENGFKHKVYKFDTVIKSPYPYKSLDYPNAEGELKYGNVSTLGYSLPIENSCDVFSGHLPCTLSPGRDRMSRTV